MGLFNPRPRALGWRIARVLRTRPGARRGCGQTPAREAALAFRFVHTADIHLDSPLGSLALKAPELAALVGGATRRAFAATVDLCLAEGVDALLIAGDLYDGGQTSMKTAGFLAGELRRLTRAGIRVFLIRGNHDAAARITRELLLPEGVHLFAGRDRPVILPGAADGRDVAVHGVSFARPHAPESLLPKFAPPVADAVNIGLMHTSLGGAEGHDPYAPVGVNDLVAMGYDYWALGHLHRRQVACTRPAIVMPGIPQGRDIGEAGETSVTLAALDGTGAAVLETRAVALAVFERLSVDVSGVEDMRALVGHVGREMDGAKREAGRQTILRLTLTGQTPLAWQLAADRDLLLGDLGAEAAGRGGLWVEGVETRCTAPGAAAGTAPAPVEELARLIAAEVVPSDAFRAEARAALEDLRRALPDAELRAAFGDSETAADALIDRLTTEGVATVLARLATAPDEA